MSAKSLLEGWSESKRKSSFIFFMRTMFSMVSDMCLWTQFDRLLYSRSSWSKWRGRKCRVHLFLGPCLPTREQKSVNTLVFLFLSWPENYCHWSGEYLRPNPRPLEFTQVYLEGTRTCYGLEGISGDFIPDIKMQPGFGSGGSLATVPEALRCY